MIIDPFWGFSHWLYKNNIKRLARIFELLSMIISSHSVSAKIKVGSGTRFYHHGVGCVILETVQIGSN